MNLSDLDLDDIVEGGQQEPDELNDPQPQDPINEPIDQPEDSLINSYLKYKGINPESIKVRNEDGEIEELQFDNLTREEQLSILLQDDAPTIPEEELNFITWLKNNNLSLAEYMEYQKKLGVQEYLQGIDNTPDFQIDQMSDDEIYLSDLKARVPNITEEEAKQALEIEKQNETIYKKKIEGLRQEYKELETSRQNAIQQEKEEQAKREYQEFEDMIVQTIEQNDTIDFGESEISLSEDDMNEIADFILDTDSTGTRYLARALNDPKTLVGMVWYALKGQEAFNQISNYYKQKITEASKYNYNKGYEDAKKGLQKTAVKKPDNTIKPKTINDLDY